MEIKARLIRGLIVIDLDEPEQKYHDQLVLNPDEFDTMVDKVDEVRHVQG